MQKNICKYRQTTPFFDIKSESIKSKESLYWFMSISSNLATFTTITMCCLPDWLQALCCLFTCCLWLYHLCLKVIKYFHITLTLHFNGRDRNSKIQTDWLILREWVSSHKTTHYIHKVIWPSTNISLPPGLQTLKIANNTSAWYLFWEEKKQF